MKNKLITSLVDIEIESARYFSERSGVNPVIVDVEYAKPSVPVGTEGYIGQNEGIPDQPFGAIYRADAKMWIYADLANITLRAAELLYQRHGWQLKVMDSLRVIEAQEAMQSVVKENNWSEEYVSPPGAGAHPRAMAVDIVPIDAKTNELINMGSAFDHFGEASNRDHECFVADPKRNQQILDHRRCLDEAMLQAADENGLKDKLYLLPSEWWDYRFAEDVWSVYPPLSDQDLPENMRLIF